MSINDVMIHHKMLVEEEFQRVGNVVHNAFAHEHELAPSKVLGESFAEFDGRILLSKFTGRQGRAWLIEVTDDRSDGRPEISELMWFCGQTFSDESDVADLLRKFRRH